MERKNNQKLSLSDRIKEGAMKEVTNSISIQLVKFKPMWTGLKAVKGGAAREVGPVTG